MSLGGMALPVGSAVRRCGRTASCRRSRRGDHAIPGPRVAVLTSALLGVSVIVGEIQAGQRANVPPVYLRAA
jgi:hypothetical protein